MTWQCPRCMVTFREEKAFRSWETPARCEVPGCRVQYHDRQQNAAERYSPVAMYLVSLAGFEQSAMEEYRRHYEKDFPDA